MGYTATPGNDAALSTATLTERLAPPDGEVRMVLDTDAYNEIDDQFALAYAVLSDAVAVEAVYAAPFHNDRSEGPGDGMEKSYEEIRRLLDLLDRPASLAYRGATDYMDDAGGEVENPATADLIERARRTEDPLYVVAIGAPTNVASAIEAAPDVAEEVVVVWLGGHPHSWHTAREFNLSQDLRASRTLFDSGVPLVQVPCKNVAEHVRTTVPELERGLDDDELGGYLLDIFAGYAPDSGGEAWSKEIWDLAPVAFLVEHEWVPTHLVHSPHLSADHRYARDTGRHLVRVAKDVRRDPLLADVFDVVRN